MQLTEAELDALVETSTNWAIFVESGMSAENLAGLKAFKKFQIDLEENYETIVEDMITVDMRYRKTGEVKPGTFFSLRAVDEDQKVFTELMNRLPDNLIGARVVG